MKTVMSTEGYTIFQRRDGRYAIEGAGHRAILAEDKVKILLEHGLVKAPVPKAPEPEPVEEVAEEVAVDEAPAEEAVAEEAPKE